jgi:hypothetical protein
MVGVAEAGEESAIAKKQATAVSAYTASLVLILCVNIGGPFLLEVRAGKAKIAKPKKTRKPEPAAIIAPEPRPTNCCVIPDATQSVGMRFSARNQVPAELLPRMAQRVSDRQQRLGAWGSLPHERAAMYGLGVCIDSASGFHGARITYTP